MSLTGLVNLLPTCSINGINIIQQPWSSPIKPNSSPVVVKSSVNEPNIFLEARSIKGFVQSHRGGKLISWSSDILQLGRVWSEIITLLLLYYTGDSKDHVIIVTPPLVSNGWCIVYVDFVRPPLLSTRLREEHGEKAGSFYRRGLSGLIKMRFWKAGEQVWSRWQLLPKHLDLKWISSM